MRFIRRAMMAAVIGLGLSASARAADVEKLLPADTESYIHVNLKQMIESDLFKKYMLDNVKKGLETNDAQKMFKALGLDPLKDIDSMTIGAWGDDPQNMKGIAVVRGSFNPEKLFEAAQAAAQRDGDKVAIVKEGKYQLVKFTSPNRPEPMFASVVDDKTLIGGTDKKLVAAAMGASDSPQAGVKPALATLVKKMDGKASMFVCGVSSGKVNDIPPIPGIDDPEKLKKQLEKVESSSMTVKVTGDVAMEILMTMKDGDAADDFGSTVDDLLGKAKAFLPLIAGQQPQMKPLVTDLTKSLKSKVDKKDVAITMKLTGGAIGKVAGSDD